MKARIRLGKIQFGVDSRGQIRLTADSRRNNEAKFGQSRTSLSLKADLVATQGHEEIASQQKLPRSTACIQIERVFSWFVWNAIEPRNPQLGVVHSWHTRTTVQDSNTT